MSRAAPTELTVRRTAVLSAIMLHLSPQNLAGARKCLARLLELLPGGAAHADTVILVLYGGGKDSSFITALARFLQLLVWKETGDTFTLRVATNFQAGMTAGVTENIDRAYQTLGMYGDPQVELIAVAGDRVATFEPGYTIPAEVIDFNRLGILMNGHRTAGSNRAMFCNSCNYSMLKAFALGIPYGGREAVAVITGDSPLEQKKYALAIARMAKARHLPSAPSGPKFRDFLRTTSDLAVDYNADLFGPTDPEARRYEVDLTPIRGEPKFFSVYKDTDYALGSHWELITQFLGFRFDTIAFTFTESDCANPALMCHLRGLKAERLWGRPYSEGVAEYFGYATKLMRQKQFPDVLIREMETRYGGAEAVARTRAEAAAFSGDVLGLTDDHLVCLLHAPFTQGGKNLTRFLAAEQPAFLPRGDAVRGVLAGASDDPALVAAVETWSGLGVARLRILFASDLIDNTAPVARPVGPIGIMFRNDPHKAEVLTRHAPDGPDVVEVESGR